MYKWTKMTINQSRYLIINLNKGIEETPVLRRFRFKFNISHLKKGIKKKNQAD